MKLNPRKYPEKSQAVAQLAAALEDQRATILPL